LPTKRGTSGLRTDGKKETSQLACSLALADTRAKLKEGFKEPSTEEEDNFILSSQPEIDYLSPIPALGLGNANKESCLGG